MLSSLADDERNDGACRIVGSLARSPGKARGVRAAGLSDVSPAVSALPRSITLVPPRAPAVDGMASGRCGSTIAAGARVTGSLPGTSGMGKGKR